MIVENRLPCHAGIGCFENPAGGGGDVNDARVRFHHREVVHTSAHDGGADLAEFQILQSGLVRGFREREGRDEEQQDDGEKP